MPNITFKNYFFKLISLYIEVILDLQEKFSNKKIWPQFPFKFFCIIMKTLMKHFLTKQEKSQITVYRLRPLCIEIFKTLHGLNPFFMKTIFIFNTI